MKKRTPDIVTKNATRIRFQDPDQASTKITVELNVGQVSFDGSEAEFIAFDMHDGEGAWFMTREEATQLSDWLVMVLARPAGKSK